MPSLNGQADILRPSSQDLIALAESVEKRFLEICGAYLRIRGMELGIPLSLRQDAIRWRTLLARHRCGDFRSTRSELKATWAVAQWTLDVNCDLRNQSKQVLTWRD